MLPQDAYVRGVADNTKGADVMSVGFGRRLNGVEFWGAGYEIIVDIGRGGRIVRVRKAWPELIPIGEYDLVEVREAVKKLAAGEGALYHGNRGEITGAKVVYYASPVAQEYAQPCYYFECRDPEDGQEFYGVIEAIPSGEGSEAERR